MEQGLELGGSYAFIWKDINQAVTLIEMARNGIVTEGLTALLSTMFAGGSQTLSWYLGLIDEEGFSTLAPTDVISDHDGWSELTSYSLATRPQWTPLTVGDALVANSAVVTFTFSASASVKGAFLASNATKGGAGTLWSTAMLPTARARTAGQTLDVYYRLRGAGSG